MNSDQDAPKIIVDDDWKQQVENEKEALNTAPPAEEQMPEMPEASFAMLVTTLSTQALSTMGLIPDPMTGKAVANLPLAKHFVDTLGILEEKTLGNLDDEEKQLLNESLHQLRMAFVMAGQSSSGEPTSEDSESSGPSIELP